MLKSYLILNVQNEYDVYKPFYDVKTKSQNKSKKITIKDLKPVQVGKNFMGLSSLKQTNGCKSCGH